jgi:hypothetical protein
MNTLSGMKEQKTEQTGMPMINTLYFYLTEGCNLACRHCWMGPRFDATGSHYPPCRLSCSRRPSAKPSRWA